MFSDQTNPNQSCHQDRTGQDTGKQASRQALSAPPGDRHRSRTTTSDIQSAIRVGLPRHGPRAADLDELVHQAYPGGEADGPGPEGVGVCVSGRAQGNGVADVPIPERGGVPDTGIGVS